MTTPIQLPLGIKESRGDPSKLRYDLIPPEAERALASILTYGASRYGDRNWEQGILWSELIASARRHLASFLEGETLDESGYPNTWHLLANIAMLVTLEHRRPDLDNITEGHRVLLCAKAPCP